MTGVASRALIIKDGRANQAADADTVIVGSGIDVDANAAVKTLNIGGVQASEVVIGQDGVTVSIPGDLDVAGAIGVVNQTTFQQDATFLGNVSFGDSDSPVDDTVSFANATVNSDITFNGAGHQVKNLAAPVDDADAATKQYSDDHIADLGTTAAGGVTGTLPVGNGGTNTTTIAGEQLFFGNSTLNKFDQSALLTWDGVQVRVNADGAVDQTYVDVLGGAVSIVQDVAGDLGPAGSASLSSGLLALADADASTSAELSATLGSLSFVAASATISSKDGTNAAAPLVLDASEVDVSSKKIVNLLDPTAGSQEAATAKYVDDGLDLKVDLAGDTMTGSLTMSNSATVTGLPAASADGDAVSKAYAEDYFLGGAGSHTLLVQDGGKYATVQAAIDAAVDGDIILVGPKAAGWGSISITSAKKLTIASYAQSATEQKLCRVTTVDVNIASGLDPNLCEINIAGLYIGATVAAGSSLVRFTGAGAARLRLRHCGIYKSGAGDAVESSNTGSGSSLYLDNCLVNGQGTSGTSLKHVSGYTLVQNRTTVDDGAVVVSCAAGNLVITDCAISANATSAGPAVSITGGTVSMGTSSINFPKASGVGVSVASGATFGAGQTSILVGTGLALATGKAITGAGTAIIGEVTYGPALVYSNVVDATTVASAVRSGGALNSALSMSPNNGTTKLKITNLANGTDANDAVNKSQLDAAVGAAAVGGVGALQYSTAGGAFDGDNALLKFTEGSSTLEVKDATKTLSLTPSSVSGVNGLDLNAASGQELALQVAGADKLLLAANSIAVQSGVTLSAASGGMIDLPSQFKINTTAVSANVTAANLDTLTGGSDASSLHVHASTEAVVVPMTTTGLVAGDVANVISNSTVGKADRDDLSTARVLGVVSAAGKVQLAGIAYAAFDSAPAVGDVVYLSSTAGKLTSTRPIAGIVAEVGIVVNSTAVGGLYAVALNVKPLINLA